MSRALDSGYGDKINRIQAKLNEKPKTSLILKLILLLTLLNTAILIYQELVILSYGGY